MTEIHELRFYQSRRSKLLFLHTFSTTALFWLFYILKTFCSHWLDERHNPQQYFMAGYHAPSSHYKAVHTLQGGIGEYASEPLSRTS